MYHRSTSTQLYTPPSENPSRFSADINARITTEIEIENEIARAQASISPLSFGSIAWRVATRDDVKAWMAHYTEPGDHPEIQLWQPVGQSWATEGTFQPVASDSRQVYHSLLRGAAPEQFWIRSE
mgnify:CR=1 FL=1